MSIVKVNMIGVRVSSDLTYTPPFTKTQTDGSVKQIPAKLFFQVAGNNRLAGDKASYYGITVWGKLANSMAFYLHKGKELHIDGRLESYLRAIKTKEGTPVLHGDGTQLEVNTPTITVEEFEYGSDSNIFVQKEIAEGKRMVGWDIEGTPGNIAWKQSMAQKQALITAGYTGGMFYGNAKVSSNALKVNQAYGAAGVNVPDAPTPTANVNGVTYDMLIAKGWTPAQIQSSAQFGALYAAHMLTLQQAVNVPDAPAATAATNEPPLVF